jgi:hypothetical protein
MAYIGKQPVVGNFVKLDAITTSATATYNLLNGGVAYFPQTANNCIVSLNGVIQSPTSAYTISGSTIVFDSALTSADTIDFILVLGDVLNIGTPSDSTVGFAKVTSNLITGATAETSIDGADSVLIYDDSATALRKMTRTNFVSGLGAAAGQVIQVVSATSTTASTITSGSFVTTGFSASITPSSASNKILVIINCTVEQTATAAFNIDRGGTLMSSETNGLGSIQTDNLNVMIGLNYLDSPSSTSSTTYTLFGRTTGTLYFDPSAHKASMVLMEIKG